MPMSDADFSLVYVPQQSGESPVLDAFRECSQRANSLEEFRALIQSTVAKEEPYQVMGADREAYKKILGGGHLFSVRKAAL